MSETEPNPQWSDIESGDLIEVHFYRGPLIVEARGRAVNGKLPTDMGVDFHTTGPDAWPLRAVHKVSRLSRQDGLYREIQSKESKPGPLRVYVVINGEIMLPHDERYLRSAYQRDIIELLDFEWEKLYGWEKLVP